MCGAFLWPMHAHFEARPSHPNCGVIRVYQNGKTFEQRDPWDFVCFAFIDGDEVELVGGCGAFSYLTWRALHDLLINVMQFRVVSMERRGIVKNFYVRGNDASHITTDNQ